MPNVTNIVELLNVAPAENTAMILPETGIRITYKGLREQVMTMADALAAAGIGRGDRVATVLPNGLPAIVTFLAATIAGTAAPLNPVYRQDEFIFYLEDTAAKLLLCPPDGADDARAGRQRPQSSRLLGGNGRKRIRSHRGRASSGQKAQMPGPDDIALVLHTSGSTGRPKRVPIRHANLGASAQNIAAHLRAHSERRRPCA